MERICVYPGSFDPVTVGHMDIIRRSAALFDRVIVAVLHNPAKRGCFALEDRLAMIRDACAAIPQVQVDSFDGLLVDYCRKCGAQVVVRGLRAVSDFESEFQMAQVNHQILPTVETLFMCHACDFAQGGFVEFSVGDDDAQGGVSCKLVFYDFRIGIHQLFCGAGTGGL